MSVSILIATAPPAARQIASALEASGHAASMVESAGTLLAELQSRERGLLIIDPALDWAIDAIRRVHAEFPAVPILLIAEANGMASITEALAAGAADYLLKPLRRHDLHLRMRILLERAYPSQADRSEWQIGPYRFDTIQGIAWLGSQVIPLTKKEFQVAILFFRHLGRPLSRAFIVEAVWPAHGELPSRTVDTHVSRVRAKLALRSENGFRLLPVYSFGYQLERVAD